MKLLGWNFVVLVYENHLPKLYVNGSLVATGLNSGRKFSRPSNGNDFTTYADYSKSGFGSTFYPSDTNNSSRFIGKVDDIDIWNRALTPEEIKYLYENDFKL